MSRTADLTTALTTAAGVGYASNVAFGVAVATGVIDNRRIRWVHHALFVATTTLTAAALIAGAAGHRRSTLALLPAIVPLAILPYAGGGIRRHAAIAAVAAPSFTTAIVMAWKGRKAWNSSTSYAAARPRTEHSYRIPSLKSTNDF
jgi:hypothetical protein